MLTWHQRRSQKAPFTYVTNRQLKRNQHANIINGQVFRLDRVQKNAQILISDSENSENSESAMSIKKKVGVVSSNTRSSSNTASKYCNKSSSL